MGFFEKTGIGKDKAKSDLEKEYNKKLNRLMANIIKNPSKTAENLTKIIDLLEEIQSKGLITEKQKNKYVQRIYREMNTPEEFREWLKNKFGFLKSRLDKAREKFNKK